MKLIFFTGASGTGKNYVQEKVIDELNNIDIKPFLLSELTTRPMRNGETQGNPYIFLESLDGIEVAERRDYETEYGTWSYATAITNFELDLDTVFIGQGSLEMFKNIAEYIHERSEDSKILLYIVSATQATRLGRTLSRDSSKRDEIVRRFFADNNDFSSESLSASGIEEMDYVDINFFVNNDDDSYFKPQMNLMMKKIRNL